MAGGGAWLSPSSEPGIVGPGDGDEAGEWWTSRRPDLNARGRHWAKAEGRAIMANNEAQRATLPVRTARLVLPPFDATSGSRRLFSRPPARTPAGCTVRALFLLSSWRGHRSSVSSL
jgi:hypothetical protein